MSTESSFSPEEIADIQILQKYLVDALKIGNKSAKACATQFVLANVDSIVALEALKVDKVTAILDKDPNIATTSKELVLKHFNDKTAAKADKAPKSNAAEDQSALQKYLMETVGLGSSSAKQVADVLAKNYVDSVSLLTSIAKEKLKTILVQPEVSQITEDMIVKALYPDTATSTATAAPPSKEAITLIENYLKTTIGLGNQSSATCALYFVKAQIDCVPLLTSLAPSELNKILDHPDVASATKTLIVNFLKNPPAAKGEMSDEEKAAMVQKAADDVQKILDEVSNANDASLKENQARLDSAVNSLNAAAAKANWKASATSKDSILGELNVKKMDGNKSITTGNFEKVADMVNSMSEGALRKAVMFVNGPGFGSRAACPLFNFVENEKKGTMQLMNTPKIDFNEVTCYTSEAQSSFEAMQKSGMSSDSFSVKAAGFYNGVAGALSVQGSFSSDSKSDSSSTAKKSSYTSYKTTSTIATINSFQINPMEVPLDTMALEDFKRVTCEAAAEQFLTNYGTHVLLTPQATGGIYNSTCTITFTSEVSQEERATAVANARTVRGGVAVVAPFGGGSAGYENKASSADGNKSINNAKNENYYYEYNVDTVGPQVLDFGVFHNMLAANNKTHCLVSNGFSLGDPATWAMMPVWELALQAPELKTAAAAHGAINIGNIACLLREAWLKKVLLTSGMQLEAFMSELVNRTLEYSLPTVDKDATWKDVWNSRFATKKLSADPDKFFVPINTWCVMMNDQNLALDVKNADFQVDKEVWAHNRNNGIAQIWRLTSEGYIENTRGFVLTIKDGTNKVVLGLRDNKNEQKFFFSSFRNLVCHANTSKALTVATSSAGTGITLAEKQYALADLTQKWRFYPVTIPVDMANKIVPNSIVDVWCYIKSDDYSQFVLDVKNGNKTNGATICAYPLEGSTNQIWKLTKEGHLESKLKPGFYLQYNGTETTNNEALDMTTETDSGNALKWSFDAERYLVCDKVPTSVLDIFVALPDYKAGEARRVGIQPKNAGKNQKWTFVPVDF